MISYSLFTQLVAGRCYTGFICPANHQGGVPCLGTSLLYLASPTCRSKHQPGQPFQPSPLCSLEENKSELFCANLNNLYSLVYCVWCFGQESGGRVGLSDPVLALSTCDIELVTTGLRCITSGIVQLFI
jgi:hypothetical protein